MIILNVLLLLTGFTALIKGAGLFVDGSAALAKRFRVPGLIIGLTIVAFGTSAPELAVSTSAALQGANEIALSNVVGSNIFNLLCVLGICAVIHPVPVAAGIRRRDFPFSIVTTIAIFLMAGAGRLFSGRLTQPGMAEQAGAVSRLEGALILALFVGYTACLIMDARKHPEKEENCSVLPLWKCLLFICVGLLLIIGGGQAVVYSAKEIARVAGMSETLIGLTIVAVGTSLPELVTSVVAARKGETGLAVGNVIGSNIFNLLFIVGISAVIHPVTVNLASVCDLGILITVSLLTCLFSLTSGKLKRAEGITLVTLYIIYVVFAAVR